MPPARRRRVTPTVQRRIYFFRADTGATDSGRPRKLRIDTDLARLHELPFTGRHSRKLDQPDGDALCGWVDTTTAPSRMRLAALRGSALPHAEDAGTLTPLVLADTARLYEPIHICFFPRRIVGVEFNFYGPRPTRIPQYLERVLEDLTTPFVLEPLLRQDAAEQLDRQRHIRVLELKVRSSYVEQVEQLDEDLGSALRAARDFGGAQVVGLHLQPERYERGFLSDRIIRPIRRLARDPGLRENALTFLTKGEDEQTGTITEVDLLRDHLAVSKRIVKMNARSRAIDPDAAYEAIEQAYAELRPELERASSVAFAASHPTLDRG
jgi:hypothetical protein